MEYTIYSAKQLGSKVGTRACKTAKERKVEDLNRMLSCAKLMIVDNNPDWGTKSVQYSRAAGAIRDWLPIIDSVATFKRTGDEFGGKVLKRRREKFTAHHETGAPTDVVEDQLWYHIVTKKFDLLFEAKTASAGNKEFNLEKWLKNVIKKAEKEDVLAELIAAANAAKTTPVQEVAEGITKEKFEDREAA